MWINFLNLEANRPRCSTLLATMTGDSWTSADEQVLIDLYTKSPKSLMEIASELNRSYNSVNSKLRTLGIRSRHEARDTPPGFTAEIPPSVERPIEELLDAQIRQFERTKAAVEPKRRGLAIVLDDPGPYAIVLLGDPHIDNPGSNMDKLMCDMNLVNDTPHCYALNIGDLTDNWVGKLSFLLGKQTVSDTEATYLMKWLIGYLRWLYVILGNHDKWTSQATDICDSLSVPHVAHGGKFKIKAGESVMVLDARHNHAGHSMYHATHAQLKKNFRGSDAHVIVAGHTHQGSSMVVKNGLTGQISHCIRLGSYKEFDDYADRYDLDGGNMGSTAMVVVNPMLASEAEGYVQTFWDLEYGAKFLGLLRAEWDTKHKSDG